MAGEQLKEAFHLHDHEGNGVISPNELGNALRSVGKRLTNENVASLRQKATEKGDIDFGAFQELYEAASQIEKRDSDIEEAFKVFDSDGSGNVNVAELKHALTSIGDALSVDEVNTLLLDAGFDGKDGETISYQKFMALIQANI